MTMKNTKDVKEVITLQNTTVDNQPFIKTSFQEVFSRLHGFEPLMVGRSGHKTHSHSKMSGNDQSTHNDDEMRILSKMDDEIPLRSQGSIPLLVIRVTAPTYFEDIPSMGNVPEYFKMISESIDLDFNCSTDFLQVPRWRQQISNEIWSTHDCIDKIDAFEELECDIEDSLDDCSDDLDDSIRLTKCRLFKNKKSGPRRLNHGIVAEPRTE
jgi:hypothetical protein